MVTLSALSRALRPQKKLSASFVARLATVAFACQCLWQFAAQPLAAQEVAIGSQTWFNWRDAREQDLKDNPVSPLTISDQIVMRRGETVGIRFVAGTSGNWEIIRDAQSSVIVSYKSRKRLTVEIDGGKTSLAAGEGLNIGDDLHIAWNFALPYRDRAALFAFDRNHNARLAFSVFTQWYDYDPAYRIKGLFIPLESAQAQFLNTSLGLSTIVYKVGTWQTRWNNEDIELPLFVESKKYDNQTPLLIPFTDMTNFGDTNRQGRFIRTLTLAAVQEDWSMSIDFNYAENPFSALSDYTNSPIPGRESHIQLDIQAGEKRPTNRLPSRRASQ